MIRRFWRKEKEQNKMHTKTESASKVKRFSNASNAVLIFARTKMQLRENKQKIMNELNTNKPLIRSKVVYKLEKKKQEVFIVNSFYVNGGLSWTEKDKTFKSIWLMRMKWIGNRSNVKWEKKNKRSEREGIFFTSATNFALGVWRLNCAAWFLRSFSLISIVEYKIEPFPNEIRI